MAHQVVALGDQLHVGVLDAVVDHLHVVAGSVGADVRAARRSVDTRGDRLENRRERPLVRFAVAAGHDARTVEGALLSAGDPNAEEVDPVPADLLVATLSVTEVRVAAVDQGVAVVEVGDELIDHRVGRRARLHHAHDHARAFECADELLDRRVARQRPLPAVLGHEPFHATCRAIVDGDRDVVMGDVAGEVRAHRRQAGQAEVR